MDSLTQIALGAACGELTLGNKIGNRAMLWGGIAGTIPDLDVLTNFVTDPIMAMVYHRHITHSLLFAVVFPFIIGFLVHHMYSSGLHRKLWFKRLNLFFWPLLICGLSLTAALMSDEMIPGELMQNASADMTELSFGQQLLRASIPALVVMALMYLLYFRRRSPLPESVSYLQWVNLFFWAIFTHPILDCCTAYGTQIFQPFSDMRVAFDNISVVDPFYTVPFMLLLLVAARYSKRKKLRRNLVWAGIAVSSIYLAYTFYNKWQVTQVCKHSLAEEGYEYSRLMTAPTIFNNFLWQGVAEGDTAYYHGQYSIFEKENRLERINVLPKNHHLLGAHLNDRDVRILRWVTNGYYNVTERPDGYLQFNHLRYGIKSPTYEGYKSYTFKWVLIEDPVSGEWVARNAPEFQEIDKNEFRLFYKRIWGRLE